MWGEFSQFILMPNNCNKCKKNVTGIRFPGLSCVICGKYFHAQCADISEKTFKDIVDSKLSWNCSSCKRRSVVFPLIDPEDATPPAQPSQSTSTAKSANNNQPKTQKSSKSGPKSTSADTITLLTDRLSNLERLLDSALLRIVQLETHETVLPQSSDNSLLTEKIQSLEARTSSIDKQLNDDTLEIQGLPECALEHPLRSVLAVGKDIGCEISESDLACVTRASSKISIAFKSKAHRRNFLVAGKAFNKNKKKFTHGHQSFRIHVNEVLSEHQRKLFRDTKTFASSQNFKFVWVGLSGLIYLKKAEGHTPFSVTSSASLENIRNANLLSELPRSENEIAAMSSSISNH